MVGYVLQQNTDWIEILTEFKSPLTQAGLCFDFSSFMFLLSLECQNALEKKAQDML